MSLEGQTLTILLAASPSRGNFHLALGCAEAAVSLKVTVFLYLFSDAVAGVSHPRLSKLQRLGVRLFACTRSAEDRGLAMDPPVIWSGLAMLSELISRTHRLVTFT